MLITAMLATILSANPSNAADQTYNLYYLDDYNQIEQIVGTQFKKVGVITSGDTGFSYTCAVDVDNKVWVPGNPSTKPIPNAEIDASHCVPQTVDKLIDFYSNLWSGSFVYHDGTEKAILSIDADGYLWGYHGAYNPTGGDMTDFSTWAMIRPSEKFYTGAVPTSEDGYNKVLLLGTSRASQSTSIVQMPTTGAPTGLSTFGVIAVGLILMGLSLKLRDRLN